MPLLDPEGREQLKTAGRVGAIGIELVIATVLGYLGGRWLDGQLGTEPWLMWIGLVLGLVAGFRSLYVLVRKTRAELGRDDPRPRDRSDDET